MSHLRLNGSSGTNVFAFLTCEPNPLVGEVHPMAPPLVLQHDDWERWLDAPTEEALRLAAPLPSQLMIGV